MGNKISTGNDAYYESEIILINKMAEGLGFEPRLTGPEPVVLPLDDPSVVCKPNNYNIYLKASSEFWIWAGSFRAFRFVMMV